MTNTHSPVVPGSHAAPIEASRRTEHLVTVCANCGETIKRNGLYSEWFHYQTDEINCGAK